MILRDKDIQKMNKEEKEEKIIELKMELIKSNTTANKSGKVKIRELRKTIARLITALNVPK